MRRTRSWLAVIALVTAGLTGPGTARAEGFAPLDPCGVTLRAASDNDKLLIAAWIFGYVASKDKDVHVVDRANTVSLLNNVFQACARDEKRNFVELMQLRSKSYTDSSGSKADAEAFLKQFLDPSADLVALTGQMAPTPEDIAAVYDEPLAGDLEKMYAQMFTQGASIGPKPDQNALIVVHATTGALKRHDPVLREFPGGYEEVLPHFIGDHPIVRFKFVKKGKSLGLAFDGLIHVNDRWVLMPKPWRALE